MNRRVFCKSTTLSLAATALFPGISLGRLIDTHRKQCEYIFSVANDRRLAEHPIGDVVIEIARLFKGAPYEAHTLEKPGEERLVINLEVFDCVTFIENVLALARCVKTGRTTFDDFTTELKTIRYRNGIIDGYPSRLHYFSDWIYDNAKKGIVRDVSEMVGGERYRKEIHFMSTNRNRYRQLANNDYFRAIQEQERILSTREYYFLPKGNFHMYEHNLKDGDILGLTTNVRGLDVQHTGFAIRIDGRLHALHASDVGGTVEITPETVFMYMTMRPRITGVMVARAVEP